MTDQRPLLIASTGEHRAGCLAFSDDDSRLAAGLANGLVLIWRLDTGRAERHFLHDLLGRPVRAVAFSAGGTLLASAGDDGQVKVRELRTGRVVLKRQHPAAVHAVAFDARAGLVATACADGVLRVWTRGGRLVSQLDGRCTTATRRIGFAPDGTPTAADDPEPTPYQAAITGSEVRVWRSGE